MKKDILEQIEAWKGANQEPNRDKWDPWFREGFMPRPTEFCMNILTEASTEIQNLRTMKESYGRLYKMVYGNTP